MNIRAVKCTNPKCNYRYHQDLEVDRFIVLPCPNCGSAAIMLMGPDIKSVRGHPAIGFASRFTWPMLNVPVNNLLQASRLENQELHQQAFDQGYTLIGFHGTNAAAAAASILIKIEDKSKTEARGKGFAVGSLYSGIPRVWAARQGTVGVDAFVLRIYVRGWYELRPGDHFDWGKMDPGDAVEDCGVEMVLRTGTFDRILALPSVSAQEDQVLLGSSIWKHCPAHSFRPYEMQMMRLVANRLGMDLNQLDKGIEDDDEVVLAVLDEMQTKALEAVAAAVGLTRPHLEKILEKVAPLNIRSAFKTLGYGWYPLP